LLQIDILLIGATNGADLIRGLAMSIQPHRSSHSRKTSLAMCLATALGVFASDATATCSSLVVTSCADSGAGTLRDTVACANSGDTVDLSTLTCSTITLASHIHILQANLYLIGPGETLLAIDGANNDRVFAHHQITTGAGILRINDLTITHGRYTGYSAEGGCIQSGGSVTLTNSTVSFCTVISQPTHLASGGGIYTSGNLTLNHSTLTGNVAQPAPGNEARGGGAYVLGNFLAKYSTISNNIAQGSTSRGGGITASRGDITLYSSTIAGNTAANVAGIEMSPFAISNPVTINNSTISGNSSGSLCAAFCSFQPTTIINSTIAFNKSANGAAVQVSSTTLNMQSSIFADNVGAGVPSDLDGFSLTITGANNLVFSSSLTLPPDTISGTCPRLGPLAANGGATRTHALLNMSPAINHGNNAGSFTNDQRGPGFARFIGGEVDIGAYERQVGAVDDRLFKSGFESGCDE
jgi:hypothetical protein